MKKVTLEIEGMTCSACSNGLENYLKKQKGVKDVSVNLVLSLATICYEGILVSDLEQYILDAGFHSVGEFRELSSSKNVDFHQKKFVFMTFLFFLFVCFSMGYMWGLFPHQNISPMIYGMILAFLTCFFLWYGWDILRSGWKNLLHKMPNMDTLVLFSVGCSFLYSLYCLIQVGFGHIDYMASFSFESSCMVIYFIQLGRMIDQKSRDKATGAIQSLVQITPNKATLKKGTSYFEVTLDEVQVGDILVSHIGEKIAVDGKVVSGKCYVDEAFITGESAPVLKEIGNSVIAGSICYDGNLEYQAEKIGKDSMISEIVKLVVNATSSKNRVQRLADKISGYFVPFIFILSCFSGLFYLLLGTPVSECLSTFVTILVIACPCALGLAVPLVSVISNGICAKQGILVKDSEVFEIAKKIDTIVFDKTGTLTYGRVKIHRYHHDSSLTDSEFLKIIASIEANSNHPIATAFSKDHLFEVTDFEILDGCGISGKIGENKYYLGNQKILEHFHLVDRDPYYKEFIQEGCSIVYVVSANKILGIVGVKDVVRKEVPQLLLELQKKDIQTILLTGDNSVTAHQIAKNLALSKIISDVLPVDKAKEIEKLKKEGRTVMMIGDGINDALALVQSDIGVSIYDGCDIAMESATVVFMNNRISNVLNLLDVGSYSYKIIRQNLFWAFFYNICMIPIAMGILSPFGIHMNPVYGSIAMVVSSLTVVFNSLRLMKKGKV